MLDFLLVFIICAESQIIVISRFTLELHRDYADSFLLRNDEFDRLKTQHMETTKRKTSMADRE